MDDGGGVHFPRPSDGKRLTALEWCPVRYRNVILVLKNPFYAGAYAYGKTEKRTAVVDGHPPQDLRIYNSGRYRTAGRGSLAGMLAYGNANEIVLEMAREMLPVVCRIPMLAGVNGTDPFCLFDAYLDQVATLGFSGVQNFSTVGIIEPRSVPHQERPGA